MIRINLINPKHRRKPVSWWKRALAVLGIGLAISCARPPTERIEQMQHRGMDLAPVQSELRAQQNKFALFRSYQRTDTILDAIEEGSVIPAPTEPRIYGQAYLCYDKDGVTCYCTGANNISCVRR